jgi:hypothetical protein
MRAGALIAAILRAAVVVAVVLVAAPATAQAGWTDARDVRGAGHILLAPALATNQRGDVVLAWLEERGVVVATARRGGRLGRAYRLPGKLAATRFPLAIDAAIDETGMATVAWEDCQPTEAPPSTACAEEVRAAVRLPGRGFSKAERVSDAGKGGRLGNVAVRAGQAAVTYGQRSSTYVAHSAGKGFRSRKIARFSRFPRVVRARNGSERLFYLTETGVQAVTRTASNHLVRAQEVTPPGPFSYMTAGGADGEQALIWKTGDGGELREGLLLPGRPMASRTLVPPPGDSYDVAIDGAANGQFVTLFVDHRNQSQGMQYSRRVPGSRAFAAPRDLPTAPGGYELDVSVRPDGAAAVAWFEGRSGMVRVGILGIDGRLRAARSFAFRTPAHVYSVFPDTSIDRRGRVWLTWLDGGHLRVARYDR